MIGTAQRVGMLMAASLLATVGPLRAASSVRRLEAIYQPFRVERALLSPDGARVAFVVRDARALELRLYAVDRPGNPVRVPLDERVGTQLRFLDWAAPDRLVALTELPAVLSIDATGRVTKLVDNARALLPPKSDEPERPPSIRPVGLLPDEPDILLLEVARRMPAGTAPFIYEVPDSAPAGDGVAPGDQVMSERPRLLEGAPLAPEYWLDLVRVNTRTGERQWKFHREVDRAGGTLLADRTGRPRLLQERGGEVRRFQVVPSSGFKIGSTDLDALLGDRATFAFALSPKNLLGERAVPLQFDFDPEVLYYASNLGRDTYGVYAVNLRTKRRTPLAVEAPGWDLIDGAAPWELSWTDSPLVFDRTKRKLVGVRFTGSVRTARWVDPEIAATQTTLEEKFPGRAVELLSWDAERARFLALVSTNGDPGRYFVFHRGDGRCVEFLRRAANPLQAEPNASESFAFTTPAGGRVNGFLTLPHAPPVARPGLVVWLHDGPWQRVLPGFNRDAQTLAELGFAVLQLNYRGSSGTGVQQRLALRDNFDQPALDDVLAALDGVQRQHPFDPRRVAIAGEGFGGYLALRALQLHPDVFRSGIAINAVVDLNQYKVAADRGYQQARARDRATAVEYGTEVPDWTTLNGSPDDVSMKQVNQQIAAAGFQVSKSSERQAQEEVDRLRRFSEGITPQNTAVDFERELLRWFYGAAARGEYAVVADAITRPVFLLHDPAQPIASIDAVRNLRSALERRHQPVGYLEIPTQFAQGVPVVRLAVMRKVGEFLNTTLYDFDVKIGEVKEKEGSR